MADFDMRQVRDAIEEIRWRQANPLYLLVHPDHPKLAAIQAICDAYNVEVRVDKTALDPPDVIVVDPSKFARPPTFELTFGEYKLGIGTWPIPGEATDQALVYCTFHEFAHEGPGSEAWGPPCQFGVPRG